MEYKVDGDDLQEIADQIRNISYTTDELEWPGDFITKLNEILAEGRPQLLFYKKIEDDRIVFDENGTIVGLVISPDDEFLTTPINDPGQTQPHSLNHIQPGDILYLDLSDQLVVYVSDSVGPFHIFTGLKSEGDTSLENCTLFTYIRPYTYTEDMYFQNAPVNVNGQFCCIITSPLIEASTYLYSDTYNAYKITEDDYAMFIPNSNDNGTAFERATYIVENYFSEN